MLFQCFSIWFCPSYQKYKSTLTAPHRPQDDNIEEGVWKRLCHRAADGQESDDEVQHVPAGVKVVYDPQTNYLEEGFDPINWMEDKGRYKSDVNISAEKKSWSITWKKWSNKIFSLP